MLLDDLLGQIQSLIGDARMPREVACGLRLDFAEVLLERGSALVEVRGASRHRP
jgi:hypothetical protein